jgi:hypothetical protein
MPMVNAYSYGNKRAAIAGKNSPEILTSYAIILRLILCAFYRLIINGFQTIRIIAIMLNALIIKDFFIFM